MLQHYDGSEEGITRSSARPVRSLTMRVLIQTFTHPTNFERLPDIAWLWRYAGKEDMVPDLNEG